MYQGWDQSEMLKEYWRNDERSGVILGQYESQTYTYFYRQCDPKDSAGLWNGRRTQKILQKWNSNENTIMFKVININFSGHWKLKKYWQNIHSQ